MDRRSFLEKITHIIWDWNGTIIDDVGLCVDIMNQLLKEHNLPAIGLKTYRNIFTFPVREYYARAGFDLEKISFEQAGQRFIDLYNQRVSEIQLQPGVRELLSRLQKAGKKQILISARREESLKKDAQRFGLGNFFDQIIGLDDDLARGKEHLVKDFFTHSGIEPQKALFIGDTEHDLDIAKALGAHYFMVSNGHNSAWRLMARTPFVYANLLSLADFLFNA